MTKENKWYSPERLLSHNAFLNFVMSPRGNGKSYSAKKRIIKNFLKDGSQAVYVRRYKTELDEVKDTFWNDISIEFPNLEFEVKGYIGYINGCEVVHFIPLSTSTNKKSASYPKVNLMVFDEYIITKTTYNRYLKNEMILFFDLTESVFRSRENCRILLMANAVSFVNPLFSFFDIVPNKDKRFQTYKDGLICLEMFTSNVFIEEKKKTKFGRLIEGTQYAKYSIENETLEDNNEFICDRGNFKYRFICAFKYDDFKIGVWQNLENGKLFCDEIVDYTSSKRYTMLLEQIEEGWLYYKGYRIVSTDMDLVKRCNMLGNIYFCSQEIKKIMQDRVLLYL